MNFKKSSTFLRANPLKTNFFLGTEALPSAIYLQISFSISASGTSPSNGSSSVPILDLHLSEIALLSRTVNPRVFPRHYPTDVLPDYPLPIIIPY